MSAPLSRTLRPLPPQIRPEQAPTALAPMQDVTNWTFLNILRHYGDPDYYFNEYFRVHEHSTLEAPILRAISENPTDRPIFAQFIGEQLESFARMVELLKPHPIAGIDLNLGCPAPKVYKKNVGGGLLRDMSKIDQIFGFLRERIDGRFTVKCRLGFDNTQAFDTLLGLVAKHGVDNLSVHGRTVAQRYRGEPDYALIKHAVQRVPCPVFANGNLSSATKALDVLNHTGCHGLMVGRAAIRNPWIFGQIRARLAGEEPFAPTLADVRAYIEDIYTGTLAYGLTPRGHASVLKKFLNFVGQSIDPEGAYQYEMRRAPTADAIRQISDKHLLGSHADKPYADEPYTGVHARPNCEADAPTCGS